MGLSASAACTSLVDASISRFKHLAVNKAAAPRHKRAGFTNERQRFPFASRRRERSFGSILTVRLFFLFPIWLGLMLTLAGCASIDRTVASGRDPGALREVFVETNLNDNRGLARRITEALRARGLKAESGPLTLLPKSAEAVVNYQDRWAWDFGEHMIFFRLTLRDPGLQQPYATATRSRHVARSTDLEAVVPELVAELLAPVVKK